MKFFVTIAAALLIAGTASAYNLYTLKADQSVPLRWYTTGAVLYFDTGAPQEVPQTVAHEIVMQGFNQWSILTCGAEETTYPFTSGGFVPNRTIGYTHGQTNENLVKWVTSAADWEHGSEVVALTSLTYDTSIGKIVDADLEINDAAFVFSVKDKPESNEMDLANTVAHEAGHFLGLDHSEKRLATMYEKAEPGETIKASLATDDIEGFCLLYGPDKIPLKEDPGTGGSAGTCTAGPSGHGGLPIVILILGSLAVLALTSRVRQPVRQRIRRASRATPRGPRRRLPSEPR